MELVPESCPQIHLKAELDPAEWHQLERLVLEQAEYRCDVCAVTGAEAALGCDESWSYDDGAHICRLERVLVVCAACREVRHIDLAARMGTADRAVLHLAAVNRWEETVAEQHVVEAFNVWEARSRQSWVPDLTRLRGYGIAPSSVRRAVHDGRRVRESPRQETPEPLTVRGLTSDDDER